MTEEKKNTEVKDSKLKELPRLRVLRKKKKKAAMKTKERNTLY